MMRPSLRLQVVSDLHVDVSPGDDVPVVAGDTCEGVEEGHYRPLLA